MVCRFLIAVCLSWGLWLGFAAPGTCRAEVTPPPAVSDIAAEQMVQSAPVEVDGVVLFRVRGVSSYPAEKRAGDIAERIRVLAADATFSPAALTLEEQGDATLVRAGNVLIMMVSNADALLEGIDRQLLARSIVKRVGEAVTNWRYYRSATILQRHFLFALGVTLLLVLALRFGSRFFRTLRATLENRFRARIQDLRVKSFEVVRGEQVWRVLTQIYFLMWSVLLAAVLYAYLHYVFSLFPWTRGLASDLFSILLAPLRTLGLGLIEVVPKLFFLLVLFFVTRFALKLLHLFFEGVASGAVEIPDFEADWAMPTYRLVRLLLIAFAVIVAYPYIPGSGSGVFQGISIFVGVVFSLGSSTMIGNMIAGYSMIYRRAFKVGDRIRIGEHLGDVEQVRLLVTHLRTPKNEEVIIPNSTILGGEVVNYSTLARREGLILHTTVGIGYETPWRQVEAMLLEAAASTPGLLREPTPFVRQKALGDFCITYEINVYCGEAQMMGQLYTDLHRNILDAFNEYGVQIMTPGYEGDPEQPKIVPREKWYAAPARPVATAAPVQGAPPAK